MAVILHLGRLAAILLAFVLAAPIAASYSPARAEVRLGNNVRIGGHDFSNRRYKGVRIEQTNKRPPWYGCRIFKPGSVYQGKRIRERTEICNLKTVPHHKRKKVQ
jgi:hypothetical protein